MMGRVGWFPWRSPVVALLLLCAGGCSGSGERGATDAQDAATVDGSPVEPDRADLDHDARDAITLDLDSTSGLDGGPDRDGGAVTEVGGGGLVAHWSFDEGAGNVVADDSGGLVGRIVSGSAEDAPDLSSPPWVPGRDAISGAALDLDATILGWIRVADAAALNRVAARNAITMAAWVKPRRLSIQGWDFIASRQVQGSASQHFGFGFFMAVPACIIGDTVVAPPTMNPTFPWMHVAFTYDGTTCRVFRNGVQVVSMAVGGTLEPDDTPLVLGANLDPPSPDDRTIENLRAIIDDVWLFDRVLTSDEIAALAR